MFNSLSGDFIAVSAALLGEGGALVEIGKRGAWSSERAGASSGASSYFEALALDTEMERDPAWMQGVLSQLSRRLGHGAVQPLPLRSFDLEQRWEAAFRLLQSGGNLGKVVIRISAPAGEASAGGQLLTGGTGGLGLLTARWLAASRGAPALVLASRRAGTWRSRRLQPAGSGSTSSTRPSTTASEIERLCHVCLHMRIHARCSSVFRVALFRRAFALVVAFYLCESPLSFRCFGVPPCRFSLITLIAKWVAAFTSLWRTPTTEAPGVQEVTPRSCI